MANTLIKNKPPRTLKPSAKIEKAERDFIDQIEADVKRRVKELKEKGYTDEEIEHEFNIAIAILFYRPMIM